MSSYVRDGQAFVNGTARERFGAALEQLEKASIERARRYTEVMESLADLLDALKPEPTSMVGRAKGHLLTIKQVAEILGVSDWTVRGLIKSGDLPSVSVAGCIRLDPLALETWIREQTEDQVQATAIGGKLPGPFRRQRRGRSSG